MALGMDPGDVVLGYGDGTDNLTPLARGNPLPMARSGSSGRSRPRLMGLSPELAAGRSADQVGLQIDAVEGDGDGRLRSTLALRCRQGASTPSLWVQAV